MSRIIHRVLGIHRVTGPAATLMFITVGALLLARVAFGSPALPTPAATLPAAPVRAPIDIRVPVRTSPGGTLLVSVDPHVAVAGALAYLPGLDLHRVPLRPDWPLGAHVARLTVPPDAPSRGYLTVRLVFLDRAGRRYTSDVPVALAPPPAS